MRVLGQRHIVQMYACVRVNQDFNISCSALTNNRAVALRATSSLSAMLCCTHIDTIPFDQSACLTGKGKKGSKKKAAGKGKGSTSAAPAAPKQSSKNQNHTDAAHSPELTVHALTEKVLEWHPDMDGAGEHSAQLLCAGVWHVDCHCVLHLLPTYCDDTVERRLSLQT